MSIYDNTKNTVSEIFNMLTEKEQSEFMKQVEENTREFEELRKFYGIPPLENIKVELIDDEGNEPD